MILLIAGQKGSGKTEVSQILESNLMEATYVAPFAVPLKEFACKILSCTLEELDNADFKKTTLPSKFDKYLITDKGKRNVSTVLHSIEEVEEYLDNNPGSRIAVKTQTVRDVLTGLDSLNDSIHNNVYLFCWEKMVGVTSHIPSLTTLIIPDFRRLKELNYVKNIFPTDKIVKVYINRPGQIRVLFPSSDDEILEGTISSFDFEGNAVVDFEGIPGTTVVPISRLTFLDRSYEHPTERAFDNVGKNFFDIIINNDSNIGDLENNVIFEIIEKLYHA